ncbi:MAG TPA: class I SAM-dependent methyltransferase [Vicinamibacteria bacterium]|nr:class I SAM-dependent methyltransferase [Vicinamibacteria bacterium]
MTQNDEHYAPAYSREQALRFPIGVDSHDTGFRYLFDFTVAARALGLRPGARVLDFASGSGFVSELLNRLGYHTVAVDLDPPTLRNARERLGLDARCEPTRAAFVGGDGQRLPFADGAFDGVLCMNALHHMPDYRTALAEMHRVLRAGGRAAFSEPGSLHSTSPESINMMRQFGVVEKDVVLEEVHALAREVGFERMVLKPYLYPELVDLDFADFEGFRRGVCPPGSQVEARTMTEVFYKSHTLFCLVKGGAAEPTSVSAPPSLLRARVGARTVAMPGPAGGFSVSAVCENTGGSTWVAAARPTGGHVTFGVKILCADGRLADDLQGRRALPRDVRPGESVGVESAVSLASLPPGRYRLVFDMVAERVAWFGDLGSPTAEHEVEVP